MNAKDRRKDKRRHHKLHAKLKRLADIIYQQDQVIAGFKGSFWTRMKLAFNPGEYSS